MGDLSKRDIEIINILKTLINENGYHSIKYLLDVANEEIEDDE